MVNVAVPIENEVSGTFAADTTQKIIEGLKDELYKKTMALEDILIKLEKANTVLGHLENNYIFSENPTPHAAIKWADTNLNDEDANGKQSHKWYWDYDFIVQLISIACDYVYASKKLSKEAVEQ